MLTKEQIGQFKLLPTGNVCDANGKVGNMDSGLKPVDPRCKMAGPAVTVRGHPGDNLVLHKAIYAAAPGSVLVMDVRGFTEAGPFGGIMGTACLERGIAGVVIDGACRDANELQDMGLPVFVRALNPGGTVKESLGPINETVQCGGVSVRPGDIIVGDRDGIVVVAQEVAAQVLERALAIFDKEIKIVEMLRAGKTTLEIYGFDKVLASKESR